ncbi:MAG TPA: carboxypeptidase-like regulatory domain-containing protein [Candidatus Sulfotelmatobacter sp.]|nr:carboxypeptidase-like regulatory domain-containing protein [Candidatus Sulfotelmatobacter sp.]
MTIPSLRLRSSQAKLATIWILSFVLLLPALVSRPAAFAAQKNKDKDKPYALIAGTVWGPDNRPVYGVRVKIRRSTDKPKKVRWEVFSDHSGEFAQRVPPGEADYILSADLKGIKTADGKPLHAQDVTVHIYGDEREDTGVHLTE